MIQHSTALHHVIGLIMIKFFKRLLSIKPRFVFDRSFKEPDYFPLMIPSVPSFPSASFSTSAGISTPALSGGVNGIGSFTVNNFSQTYTLSPASDEINLSYDAAQDKIRMELDFVQASPSVCIYFDKASIPEMLVLLIKIASEQECIEANPTLEEAYERFLMIAKLSL